MIMDKIDRPKHMRQGWKEALLSWDELWSVVKHISANIWDECWSEVSNFLLYKCSGKLFDKSGFIDNADVFAG